MTDRDDWEISIFVAQPTPTSPTLPPDEVETHSFSIPNPFGSVAKVSASAVQDQWDRTIDTLMKLTSTVSDKAMEWTIDEIEVGLTLSAKGELLFIAEAGAEGSIKFTLKKKGGIAPDEVA